MWRKINIWSVISFLAILTCFNPFVHAELLSEDFTNQKATFQSWVIDYPFWTITRGENAWDDYFKASVIDPNKNARAFANRGNSVSPFGMSVSTVFRLDGAESDNNFMDILLAYSRNVKNEEFGYRIGINYQNDKFYLSLKKANGNPALESPADPVELELNTDPKKQIRLNTFYTLSINVVNNCSNGAYFYIYIFDREQEKLLYEIRTEIPASQLFLGETAMIGIETNGATFDDFFFSGTTSQVVENNIERGLVARYSFNQGTAEDVSEKGNHHGTVFGATLTTAITKYDITGEGLAQEVYFTFNGIDNYIEIPYSPELENEIFSISLWTKVTREVDDTELGNYTAISSDGNTDLENECFHGYNLFITGDPDLNGFAQFSINSSNTACSTAESIVSNQDEGEPVKGDPKLNDGEWHHVVIVYNSSLMMYVDGRLQNESNEKSNHYKKTNQNIVIGMSRDPQGNGRFFKGGIDEVRIYNRALFASEVAELFQKKDEDDGISNSPPDTPILNTPADDSVEVELMPTLTINEFNDSNEHDFHYKTDWVISTTADFENVVFSTSSSRHLTKLTIPIFVLEPETVYYWRAKFYDNNGENSESEWSDTFSFTTTRITNDIDDNGVPDALEVDPAAKIDLDRDGIWDMDPDKAKDIQLFMTSLNNKVIGNGIDPVTSVVGISKRGSVTHFDVSRVESIDPYTHKYVREATLGLLNRPFDITSGLICARLTNCEKETIDVTLYFDKPIPLGAKWFMYDTILGWQDMTEKVKFSEAGYLITSLDLEHMREEEYNIPEAVITKLEDNSQFGYMIDRQYETEAAFLEALEHIIGAQNSNTYGTAILNLANKGYREYIQFKFTDGGIGDVDQTQNGVVVFTGAIAYTAEAGEDVTVDEKTKATLDATGSASPEKIEASEKAEPDKKLVEFKWEFVPPDCRFFITKTTTKNPNFYSFSVLDPGDDGAGISGMETDDDGSSIFWIRDGEPIVKGDDQIYSTVECEAYLKYLARFDKFGDINEAKKNGFLKSSLLSTETIKWKSAPEIETIKSEPVFTAPDVRGPDVYLKFKLSVTYHNELDITDSSDDTAIPDQSDDNAEDTSPTDTDMVNVLIAWINDPPVADAGPNYSVDQGELVELDGRGSTDSDDGIVLYEWKQVWGTYASLEPKKDLDDNTIPGVVRFIAPQVRSGWNSQVFDLTVTDASGEEHTDKCQVDVLGGDAVNGCFIDTTKGKNNPVDQFIQPGIIPLNFLYVLGLFALVLMIFSYKIKRN